MADDLVVADSRDLVQPQVPQPHLADEVLQDLAHAAQAEGLGLQPRAAALHHHIVRLADPLEDRVVAQLPVQQPLDVLVDELAAQAPARSEPLGHAFQPDDIDQSRGQSRGIAKPVQHFRQIGRVQIQDRRRGRRAFARRLRTSMKRFCHPRTRDLSLPGQICQNTPNTTCTWCTSSTHVRMVVLVYGKS